jgi:hypothetical protein
MSRTDFRLSPFCVAILKLFEYRRAKAHPTFDLVLERAAIGRCKNLIRLALVEFTVCKD